MTLSVANNPLRWWLLLCACSLILPICRGVFHKSDLPSAARTKEPSDVIGNGTKKCERYKEKCDPEKEDCSTVEICHAEASTTRKLCYASWRNSTEGIQIVMKGCWMGEESCFGQRQCIQRDPIRSVYFCCCEGDFCNRNITFQNAPIGPGPEPEGSSPHPPVRRENNSQLLKTVLYSIVPIIGGAVIIVAVFFIWKRHQRHLYTGHQQLPTVEPCYISTPSETSLNLEKVELLELRARGRFIASEKRGENLNVELWLLTEFHEHGSLYDYLKGHVLTWSDLCKIGETMARGLAFVHDEIPATSLQGAKPAVAHRDFKSKNVLLKADLSACIADFGLALKFEPGKGPGETHGLVGTRRYMAPEVLEGAICFNRDSFLRIDMYVGTRRYMAPEVLEGAICFNRDSFLRIDMYACGLVLWELMSRCNAAEGPVEEYQLPFEAAPEVGMHPTLEIMQDYVVTRKMRPAIHEHWKRHPVCIVWLVLLLVVWLVLLLVVWLVLLLVVWLVLLLVVWLNADMVLINSAVFVEWEIAS
ncbi:hypothetical protein BaRGS_00037076 [Batillaria attramentaria]|uniref:Serine/threonine-protein kinase receptor n=1 Tax=Batillaria attramentaria TaxID=370345 RepID=A0ABD0JAW3_9CAEN